MAMRIADLERLYTLEEFASLPDDGYKYELIEGRLHVMSPTGRPHGKIGNKLNIILGHYILENDLGEVHGPDSGFDIFANGRTVLCPDIAFIAAEHLKDLPEEGFVKRAPDLAVEVLSPGNTKKEMRQKITLYQRAGVQLIWILDPAKKTLSIYRLGSKVVEQLGVNDELSGEDVVPGFKLKLNKIF